MRAGRHHGVAADACRPASLGNRGLAGPVQLMPHLLGILAITTSSILPFTDRYRAGWLFLTVPSDVYRGFARGLFWAMWIAFVGIPAVTLLLVGAWKWGARDGLLFAAYSLAVTSSYLGSGIWWRTLFRSPSRHDRHARRRRNTPSSPC